ncbi:MAG: Fic family protein [Blastocatellia bacterium]|nr:Fic family protein [Blastocatellia bacterium]
MNTFRQFNQGPVSLPSTTGWHLADLGEARGRQDLYTRQSPQRLQSLREHALIESAVSSNRIEGVEVEQARIGTVLFGQSRLRDRDEEEVRGYRDALAWIHEQRGALPVSEETILRLHLLSRGKLGDAGQYKQRDSDIIERYPDGRSRVRFKTVSAAETPRLLRQLLAEWEACTTARTVHPLIAMAAFNLDFLCIHPFRDGNGRVSRLLLLLQLYHAGFEVGRYISLERLIEQNKERYYETLERSSQGWHETRHDPWPFINYALYILKQACQEFEKRVGETASPRGSKTELIAAAIAAQADAFTLQEILKACPTASQDLIRKTLGRLRKEGQLECHGRGPGALWRKKGNSPKSGTK